MKRILSVLLSIALLFAIAAAAMADAEATGSSEKYMSDADISGWENIVKIVGTQNALYGIREDGTVLSCPILGAWFREDLYLALKSAISTWTDIQDLVITLNPICIAGLKKDGTVVCTIDAGVDSWTDITQLTAACGALVGLRKDGTVVVTDKYVVDDMDRGWDDEWVDVSDWENIVELFPYYSWTVTNGLFGLKADGTLVFEYPSSYDWPDKVYRDYIYEWEDIVSVCATIDFVYGLKSDGTVAVEPWLVGYDSDELNRNEHCLGTNPYEWKDVSALYHGNLNDLYAVHTDGSVSELVTTYNDNTYQETVSWNDIKALYPGDAYVIGLTQNGLVKCSSDFEQYDGYVYNVDIKTWENVKDIVDGSIYVAGLTQDGRVYMYYGLKR